MKGPPKQDTLSYRAYRARRNAELFGDDSDSGSVPQTTAAASQDEQTPETQNPEPSTSSGAAGLDERIRVQLQLDAENEEESILELQALASPENMDE